MSLNYSNSPESLAASHAFEEIPELDPQVEDTNVHIHFAKVLKDFRINFGHRFVNELVRDFRKFSAQEILNSYEQNTDQSIIENWILECQFWDLVETVFQDSFVKGLSNRDGEVSRTKNINKFTSRSIMSDNALIQNPELSRIYVLMRWLSKSFKLDITNNDYKANMDSLPATKWLNTKMRIQSNNPKYAHMYLDDDFYLRSNSSDGLHEDDTRENDSFFKACFHLLLSGEIEQIFQLCENTNNWGFSLILTALQDYIDPRVELDDNAAKPVGVKNTILWRRSLYQLSQMKLLSKYEKSCYGFLCGDVNSCEQQAHSWESKLLIYLNNIFLYEVEQAMVAQGFPLKSNLTSDWCPSGLPRPPKAVETITDALNILSSSPDHIIAEQSQHPLRVLMGSVMSNKVESLMRNSLDALQNLLLHSAEGLDSFELTSDAYLLRVLVHFAIVLELIFGDQLISNTEYTQLLRSYISRLILYKHYDLIPIYISFIPNDEDLVDTCLHLFSHYQFDKSERVKQLKVIRQLNLPLESILRKSAMSLFKSTQHMYIHDQEICLSSQVTECDRKLFSTVHWFHDAGMLSDCVESLVSLFRRLLLCGKIQATIEMIGSMNIREVIREYKYKVDSLEGINELPEGLFVIPAFKLDELMQYQIFAENFKSLNELQMNTMCMKSEALIEKVLKVSTSIEQLIKSFLFDLSNDEFISLEDRRIYRELRHLYIPVLFDMTFNLLVSFEKYASDLLITRAVELVHLLGSNQFKLYEVFRAADKLKLFLKKFAVVFSENYIF
ncbi:hypothetical protein KL930_003389 [Ogataea haglerorum]|uniref:Nuclear pore complex protein n=1 Tax=Ogataea haglerorum TaxID=1937702 RepID=A0ABQ7RIC6_9ASCO|nr:uncharacterized protein KL911_002362 [Ogataea haglerorum]KAG7696363.1 hypothetical protein KL915_002727 [Ogataea haglerorum]KAG7706821.1 hypothetical protein KL914_002705 [Ogataea haglerorum]KAG7747934.1 hypothetical protein KL912_002611 [Ogataea haglerorum]KAG7753886.1 hypothetical protein KL911_002362 [Ogataea haglerorum]KAG7758554.1 hypothetical protein KL947_002223 [Ogataea haglerorum]